MANTIILPAEIWKMTEDWKPLDEDTPLDFTMSNLVDYFVNRKACDGMLNNNLKRMNKKAFFYSLRLATFNQYGTEITQIISF